MIDRDPLNVVLWYMILQKKNMLMTLFRQDRGQKKMADFFGNNFAEARWKSAASKNAYALLSKKMFEQSAGFFLLGGFLNVMGKGGGREKDGRGRIKKGGVKREIYIIFLIRTP